MTCTQVWQHEQQLADALWQFSLEIYPSLKSWLLRAQDEHGANVNVLLLILFFHQHRLQVQPSELAILQHEIKALSEPLTQKIRQLRRQLPSISQLLPHGQAKLKTALLEAELLAEQQEQYLLCQLAMQLKFTEVSPCNSPYLQQMSLFINDPALLFDLDQAYQQWQEARGKRLI